MLLRFVVHTFPSHSLHFTFFQVKAHLYVGTDVKIFTAPPGDEAACTAMSALVRGMDEEKCVIIARFGYNAISAPKMVSLSPHISPSKNGKYDVSEILCRLFRYN